MPVIERLDGMQNYNNWKFTMEMFFVHDEFWKSTEPEKAEKKYVLWRNQVAMHMREMQKPCLAYLQKAFEDKGMTR